MNNCTTHSLSYHQYNSIQFTVSGADGKPVISLGKTYLTIATEDDTFAVQLVVTRNILFPTVLGIDFIQKYGGVIRFLTNQLHLTKTIAGQASTFAAVLSKVQSNECYHITNKGALTNSARANTIMTIQCTIFSLGNYLFELSGQLVINTENNSLPVHFINHRDQEAFIIKHSYADAMEKVLELNQKNGNLPDNPPEPVSQYTLSEYL